MALVTEAYAAEQKRLHATDKAYGSRGFNFAYLVAGIAQIEGCRTILDYGCGKGTLYETLRKAGLNARAYDPGVRGREALPNPADLVVAVDVLEHIEPECLGDVLDHLADLTNKVLFVYIPTIESKRTMSDGRNTHISVHPADWWALNLRRRAFDVRRVWPEAHAFVALLESH